MDQVPEQLDSERQWQLALAYLKRADESANYLRTLLFAAASGVLIEIVVRFAIVVGS
jgi:hypothetical protein